MSRRPRALSCLLLVFVLAACAHYPVNARSSTYRKDAGYRFDPLLEQDAADELFICLSFSGGGTRAAALAYGVMQALREARIPRRGVETALLEEVDCIASVSGGSFTAAYYALFGPRLFEDFETRVLRRNIERELTGRTANPLNLLRLLSPYWSRIDLAAELYDETVFAGKTFGDLIAARRRPFILVNATHLANGARFEFTQDEFDFLGSDLAPYPVARAVAASSAFPFLLSPVSLRSYPPPAGFSPPEEYRQALGDRELNVPRYDWAQHRMSLLAAGPKWVHLVDGGLSDNIGLRAIMRSYEAGTGFIGRRINDGRIKRLVIIAVNARTDPPQHLTERERPPGLLTVGYKTATVSMENYSVDTIDLVRRLAQEREKAQRDIAACQSYLDRHCPAAPPLPQFARPIRTCIVEVSLDALQPAGRRDEFLRIPTSFALPDDTVDALIEAGRELLGQSADFQRLLRALRNEPELGAGVDGETGNCS